MAEITVQNLVKSFEVGSNILDGLSFSVNEGEHVAILGVNGSGKTTLFNILTGKEDYDEGHVSISSGRRIGLISQIPSFPDLYTTDDVLRSSKAHLKNISSRMHELENAMETSFDESILKEYDSLQSEFMRLGGYEAESSINKVANGLAIDQSMRQRPFSTLSGGEKTRVNLARLILEDTDILLLDEPTNHLDLHATQWLERFVKGFKGTVLTVSHDRYFLDEVAERCIEIVDGKAEFYSGNYTFFTQERQRRFDEKLKQFEKDSAKIAQLQQAADKLHLWAFMGNDKLHKRAFSIEKRIDKLKTSERPKKDQKLSVKFKEADFTGDEALVLAHLSKAFPGKPLFDNLDLVLTPSESLAITGDNGSGKSTLLEIITGKQYPDSGWVYLAPQVKLAYLPQTVTFENESRNLIDTMLYECKCTPQDARDRLASFGFRGESVLNAVGNLSGGERSRLKLCMLMGSNINLLILDEPTNHLDIASREWIEDALSNYDRTLIFVSHDRYFIDKFATRVLSFDEGGKLTDYKGTYREYLAYLERCSLYTSAEAAQTKDINSTRQKKKSSGETCAGIEKKIAKLEVQLYDLSKQAEEYAYDYLKLMEIEKEKESVQTDLDILYRRWEELLENKEEN